MRTATLALLAVSAALQGAIGAAATSDPEPCVACQEPANSGLCHSQRCQNQVLPVLRESSLKKDTHSGKWYDPVPARAERTHAADHATKMAAQAEKSLAKIGRVLRVGTPQRTSKPRPRAAQPVAA
jgi:hypothetical protein